MVTEGLAPSIQPEKNKGHTALFFLFYYALFSLFYLIEEV
jgi:hypothetical protein